MAHHHLPHQQAVTPESVMPILHELEIRSVNTITELEEWLADRSKTEAWLEENFAWRYIKMTRDTANKQLADDYQYFVTEIEPLLAPVADKLDRKLVACKGLINTANEGVALMVRRAENAIRIFRPENIELQTRVQLLSQQYQAIMGGLTIKYDGCEYPLAQAARFLKDNDRSVREKVWRLMQETRLAMRGEVDDIFNELVQLRHQMAVNAGFKNFVEYSFVRLNRFDYTPADCMALHQAVKTAINPILARYARQRQVALGVSDLKPWDMDVELNAEQNLQPCDSGEELAAKCEVALQRVDAGFGAVIGDMRRRQLLDIDARKSKAPGGYNYPLSESNAAFIFMNNANLLKDLITMVHEAGHAVHAYACAQLPLVWFKHCPSEVAELASMGMELLSMNHWDVYYSNPNDLAQARLQQLERVLETFPWVSVVDSFQHWIYENPAATINERHKAFADLHMQFGGSFCDWEGLETYRETMWHRQLHIFELPFYYIEYAIAQLGAIGIYRNYLENKDKAVEQYKAALALGNTRSIADIYATAGTSFSFNTAHINALATFVSNQHDKIEQATRRARA